MAPDSSYDRYRIPFELICIVINSTKDIATLDRWCIATSQHPALLKVCLKRRWASVVITQRDFLDSWGDTDSPPISNPFDSQIPALTCSVSQFQPAAFIRKLNLYFHFRPPSTNLSDDQDGLDDTAWDDLPCSEDMQYSLSILLPACTGLSELKHQGTLHQDNLDLLTTLAELPLRKLVLRKTAATVSARWRCSPYPYGVVRDGTQANGFRADFEHMTLRWNDLARLSTLQSLEISQLFQHEGRSLAQAIGRMEQLERLLVLAHPNPDSDDPEGPSPLNSFLEYIFPVEASTAGKGPICKLPSRLRSLVISDPYSRSVIVRPLKSHRSERLIIRRRVTVAKPSPSVSKNFPELKDLFLDVDNMSALEKIFCWMDLPVLERLAIPAVITIAAIDPFAGAPTDERHVLVDTAYPDYCRLINCWIRKHMESLNEVTLLNAWQNSGLYGSGTVRELHHDWDCNFSTKELVLGTKSPDSYDPRYPKPESNELRNSLFVPRRGIDGPRWGSNLERLRIDQLAFENLEFARFASQELSNLKILMLHPWPKWQRPSQNEIATGVMSQNLPRLRVLNICGSRFWLERNNFSTQNSAMLECSAVSDMPPKLWDFSRALKDAKQSTEIARWLSVRDWSFLDDIPAHPCRDDQVFGRCSSLQTKKHRNYMVLTKEDATENDKKASKEAPRAFVRHERDSMDLTTWALPFLF